MSCSSQKSKKHGEKSSDMPIEKEGPATRPDLPYGFTLLRMDKPQARTVVDAQGTKCHSR